MNNKKSFITTLLSALFLATLPMFSYADDCADIRAKYWRCTRASMIGEKCTEDDNVSIPPECLGGGKSEDETPKSPSDASASNSPKETSPKETRPFIYPKPDLVPKKPVKVVNIKPFNNKSYLETEEDVEQFTTKIKTELLNAIKDGKKVRLQFN
ncbi:MAG: hypothetical protein PHQ03_03055 [Methylococcales bacterium]|nr:hypothetical protein [Methylococcales bacterium]